MSFPISLAVPGETARGDPRAKVESGPRLRRRETGVEVLPVVRRVDEEGVGVALRVDGESASRLVDGELLTGVVVFELGCRIWAVLPLAVELAEVGMEAVRVEEVVEAIVSARRRTAEVPAGAGCGDDSTTA